MQFRFGFFLLLPFLLLFGGCAGLTAPAVTGVSGNTLFSTGFAKVAFSANAPLEMQGHGSLWVSLYAQDSLSNHPEGNFAYAVYADTPSGPVTRQAHTIILQISDDIHWSFQLNGFVWPTPLGQGQVDVNGTNWTTRIMRVPSEGDWFSAMWVENGRTVPAFWLAKRFSATPQGGTRMVAEYREPWPDCLPPDLTELAFAPAECLKGYMDRADAAFTLDSPIPGQASAKASGLKLPPSMLPDTRKLAGEVRRNFMMRP